MKLQFFAGFLVAILALVGVWAYASWDRNKMLDGQANQNIVSNDASSSPATGGKKSPTSETLTGTIECLPHKGDGPHTMECAVGIKTDQGQHYALTMFDYPSAADVGDHVKLVGVTVTTDELHASYDIVGTFQVASVEKI
ncbi:MAG TPA: hypothetical protein VHD55_00480 [Candidatus Paceibacterota bacterium]|nr:hypothetical protein [Candidatus Paceibacterota bacterium]